MEQNGITGKMIEEEFVELKIPEPEQEVDEVANLIKERYLWQLNDAEKLYDGGKSAASADSDEQTKLLEQQNFLAWLADRPQRLYGGESWTGFLSIIDSYFAIHKLWELLKEFYEDGEYGEMVEELMKYDDRATEIPLIMVVENQRSGKIIHGEIRKVWFAKLNKEKSVIILVIDKGKLMAMEQEH